jgi:tetratricopeptide (TPR) repeat protein
VQQHQSSVLSLEELLQHLTEFAKHPDINRVDLKNRLDDLQTILRKRELAEMCTPITNWKELDARMAQMKSASKRGDFNNALEVCWKNLKAFLNSLNEEERLNGEKKPEYWKARTLLFELSGVFRHDPEINEQVRKDGQRVYSVLKALANKWDRLPQLMLPNQELSFRKLIREQVLFCLYVGEELTRRGKMYEAGEMFDWLIKFTEEKVKTPRLQCFGTRAALSYGRARIFRIQQNYKMAQEYYTQAINLYFERAKSRGIDDKKNRGLDDNDDVLFTTRRIAMCIGLGFGWVNLTRGYFRRAENALAAARAILAQKPDLRIVHYIEFMYGNIKRCRAGRDPNQLQEAISSLKLSFDAFQKQENVRYQVRAAKELALAYTLKSDFPNALLQAQFIDDHAKDLQGRVDTCVIRSRIFRNQGDYRSALEQAEEALKLISESEEPLPRIDALLARGESFLYSANDTSRGGATVAKARRDFEEAQKMLLASATDGSERRSLNPKISAVCELRIAECLARSGNLLEAERHFAEAKRFLARVEHRWVHDLAKEVRAEIDIATGSLVMTWNDSFGFDRGARVAALDKWIAQQALNHTKGNSEEAAQLLGGISLSTLKEWLKGLPRTRARIAKSGKTDASPPVCENCQKLDQ